MAGFLPYIRERHPWLHKFFLHLRDRILPYEPTTDLTRYQFRAVCKFLDILSKEKDLETVLEIGSDLSGAVARELKSLGVKSIIGINPFSGFDPSGDGEASFSQTHFLQSDARWLPFSDCSISSIFSVATFEHIHNLNIAIDEFFRVLQPGGFLYSDFGPIWSSSVGHHVYAVVGDEEARHWKPGKNPVPNYGHLLYSPDEFREQIKSKVSQALLDAIIDWIYMQDGINRLFYEDYFEVFQQSNFQIETINEVHEHISPALEKKLQERYSPYTEFRCRMIEIILRKPASM